MLYRICKPSNVATAAIDVRRDDELLSILIAASGRGVTSDDPLTLQNYIELSVLSQISKGVNDTTGVIATFRVPLVVIGTLATPGYALTTLTQFMDLPDIKVSSGERLYVHTEANASIEIDMHIYTKAPDDGRIIRRR